MAIRPLFASLASTVFAATIAFAIPSIAWARGADDKPAPQTRPDQSPKVYTNDDLGGWRSATPSASGDILPSQTSGAIYVPGAGSANGPSTGGSVNSQAPVSQSKGSVNPEQDPQLYARRLAQMETELAAVESKEAELRDFRASGSTQTQQTGLVLNAPCEGITTDNQVAQLEVRRRELTQQIDGLDDLAQANGLPPGSVAQAYAAGEPQPSEAQRRGQAASRYRQLSDEIAQTQAATADMQRQAASQNINLLSPASGQGGNMTTDMLARLAARSDDLQNQASSVEGEALSLGAQPGDLR